MEIKLPMTNQPIYHLADVLSEINLSELERYNAEAQEYPKTREAARYRHLLLQEIAYTKSQSTDLFKPRWISDEVWTNIIMLRAMVLSPDVYSTALKLSQENKDFIECMKMARSFYPGVSRQVLACENERCSSVRRRVSASACASHFRAIHARLPMPSDMYRPKVRTKLTTETPWSNLPCPNRYCAPKDHVQIEEKLKESKLSIRVAAQKIETKPRELSRFLPSEISNWWININAVEREQLIKNGATDILKRYSLEYNAFFGTGDGDYGILDLYDLHWSDYNDRLDMATKIRSFAGKVESTVVDFDESVPFARLVPQTQDLALIGIYADDMAENNALFEKMRDGTTTLAQWREFIVNRIDKLREKKAFDYKAACQLIVDRYIAELIEVMQLAKEQYPTSAQYVSAVCVPLISGLQSWTKGSQPIEAMIARYCGRHDIEMILLNGKTSLQILNAVHVGEDDAMMQITRAFKAKGPYVTLPSFESTVIGRFTFAGNSIEFDNDIESLRLRSKVMYQMVMGTQSTGVRKADAALSDADEELAEMKSKSKKVSRSAASPRSVGYVENSPAGKDRSGRSPMSIGYQERTPSIEYPDNGTPRRDQFDDGDEADSDSEVHPSIKGDDYDGNLDVPMAVSAVPTSVVTREDTKSSAIADPIAITSTQPSVSTKPTALASAKLTRGQETIDLTSDRPFMMRPASPDRVLFTLDEQVVLIQKAQQRLEEEKKQVKPRRGRPKKSIEPKIATGPVAAVIVDTSSKSSKSKTGSKRKAKPEPAEEPTPEQLYDDMGVPLEPVFDNANVPVDSDETNADALVDSAISAPATSKEPSGTPSKVSRNSNTPQSIRTAGGAKSAPGSPRQITVPTESITVPAKLINQPVQSIGEEVTAANSKPTLNESTVRVESSSNRNPMNSMTSGNPMNSMANSTPITMDEGKAMKRSSRSTRARPSGTPGSSNTTPSSATSSAVSSKNTTAHVDQLLLEFATEFPMFRQFLRDALLRAHFLQNYTPASIWKNVKTTQGMLEKNQKMVDDARAAYFNAIANGKDSSKEEATLSRFADELAPALSNFSYDQLQLNLLRYDLADQQMAFNQFVKDCDVTADSVLADMKKRGDYDLTFFRLGNYVKRMASIFEDQHREYLALSPPRTEDIEQITFKRMRELAHDKFRTDAEVYNSVGGKVVINYMLQDEKTLKKRMTACATQAKNIIALMDLEDDDIYATMMNSLPIYMYLQLPAVTTVTREVPDSLKPLMANRMTVSVIKSTASRKPVATPTRADAKAQPSEKDGIDAADEDKGDDLDQYDDNEDEVDSGNGDSDEDSSDEEWSEESGQEESEQEESGQEETPRDKRKRQGKESKVANVRQPQRTLRSATEATPKKEQPTESDRTLRMNARKAMQPAEQYLQTTKPVAQTSVQVTVSSKNRNATSKLQDLQEGALKQLFGLMYERAAVLKSAKMTEKVSRIQELRNQLQQEQANLDKVRAAYLVAEKRRTPDKESKQMELVALSTRLAPIVDEFAKLQLELNLLRYDLLDQQMSWNFLQQNYSVTSQNLLDEFYRATDYDLLKFHFQSYLSVMVAMFTREYEIASAKISASKRREGDTLADQDYVITLFLVESYLGKQFNDSRVLKKITSATRLDDVSLNESLMKKLIKLHTNEVRELNNQLDGTPAQLYGWMWENYKGMIYAPEPAQYVSGRAVPQVLLAAGLRVLPLTTTRLNDFDDDDEDGWVSYSEDDETKDFPSPQIKSEEPRTQQELDDLQAIRSALAPAELKPKDAVKANLYRRRKARLGPDGKRLPTDKMKPLGLGEVTNYDFYWKKLMDFNYNPPEDKLTPAYVYAVNRLANEVQDEFVTNRLSEDNVTNPKLMQANLSMYINLYRAHQAGQGRVRATRTQSVASLTAMDDDEVKSTHSKEPEFVGSIPPEQLTTEQNRLYSLLERVLEMEFFTPLVNLYGDDAVYHGYNRVAKLIETSPTDPLISNATQEQIVGLVKNYAKEYYDELNS